jgi:magnesium transporter
MSDLVSSEEQVRAGPAVEVDGEFAENILALVEDDQRGMVLNIVADLHPADLALLLSHLPFDDAQRLFRWLPTEVAGDILAELDDDFRALLLQEAQPERITALLDELSTDDAADVLADLPHDVVQQVLPALEDAEEVQELLAYDEESAGGIMEAGFVAVPPTWTVAEATEEVRRNAETVEHVYALFVIDEQQRLQGIVPLKRLLLSRADVRIDTIMDPDVLSVTTSVDQEEVARIMERYDLVSLPVVDEDGCLVGRITIDDVVDVIREEAEEDIQRMSGVSGGEEPTDSVVRIIRGRLPWLLAGLCGAGLAATVIGAFEGALEEIPILAAFIPIVMATAGNAGIQSSAIAVQGLASGDVWDSDVLQRLGKELAVAVCNAVFMAAVLAVGVMLVAQIYPLTSPLQLATTAGLALVIVIVLATTIGATVPLLLNRLKIDPALATGPFITTSNDILGILIFFGLAELFYLS